jgi:hypothetical protein
MAAVSARPTPRRRVLMFRCLHYSVDFRSEAVNQLTFVEAGPQRGFVYARSYDFCLAPAENHSIFVSLA